MTTRRLLVRGTLIVAVAAIALSVGGCSKTVTGSGTTSGTSSTTNTTNTTTTPGGSTPDTAGAVKISTAQNGSSQTLAKGQKLVIVLEANPSTGYEWQPKDGKIPAQLDPVGEAKYEQGGAPGAVGAGGTTTWTFTGAQAGTGKLSLVYVRPWEGQSKPAQVYEVTVTVK